MASKKIPERPQVKKKPLPKADYKPRFTFDEWDADDSTRPGYEPEEDILKELHGSDY